MIAPDITVECLPCSGYRESMAIWGSDFDYDNPPGPNFQPPDWLGVKKEPPSPEKEGRLKVGARGTEVVQTSNGPSAVLPLASI